MRQVLMIAKQLCLQTLNKHNGDMETQTSKAPPARLTLHHTDKVSDLQSVLVAMTTQSDTLGQCA